MTRTAKKWEYIAGEVDWLLGTDTPENIARRLGYTRGSLERMLYRHGHHAVAAAYHTIDNAAEEPW